MSREYKSLPFTTIKADNAGSSRVRAGIAAVFGNIDAFGDRVMPGAFTKTLAEGAKRARFLWNHSYEHPPIASIVEMREVSREELPAEVLEKSPDATGGLLVKREYYDVELANWILQAIDAGDINEMSFAFDVVKSNTISESVPGDAEKIRDVRELTELKLYDASDVLWGCNFATVATGAKSAGSVSLGVVASQLALTLEQVKAGRGVNADPALINLIHATAAELHTVVQPESGKGISGIPAAPPNEQDELTVDISDEAGAANDSTPLPEYDLRLKAMKLRADVLRLSITEN